MTSLVLIVAGSLLATPPTGSRPIPLRLERGQEFIYSALHRQESDRPGSLQSWSLEIRVLILDHDPQQTLAAFMTTQRLNVRPGQTPSAPVVRLELGRVDQFGRVTLIEPMSTWPQVPIDGPPTLETVPFLELPTVEPGRSWEVADPELGPQTWRVLKTELHHYGQCLKVKGEQGSSQWSSSGRLAWRREMPALILLHEGVVARLERSTTWRTESGEQFKADTVIELTDLPASLPPAQLKDRQYEIERAVQFGRTLAELMKPRGEPNYRGFDELIRAIDRHNERGTPYEAAIAWLRRRAELARSGERPPEPVVIVLPKPSVEADSSKTYDVGDAVPDLTLSSLTGTTPLALASLRGRPTMLVYFKPSSKLIQHIMDYLRATQAYAGHVHVIPLAIGGEAESMMKLRQQIGLQSPIFDGRASLPLFAGQSTPRIVILDATGIVRVIAPGWGGEYPEWLHKELSAIAREK